MTVYIEYVLIDNFIIDYLLLKATFATTATSVKKGRLFLCAFFGAIVALTYPLIGVNAISISIKILCGLLMPLIGASPNSVRQYAVNTAIFFTYTFLTGGAIIGVFTLFNIDYSAEISIALMFLPVYFLVKFVKEVITYIYRQKTVMNFTFEIELTLADKSIKARGFLDTGNDVYDGDNPVILCGKRFAQRFIGENFYKIKSKRIALNTVSGKSENFALILEGLVIYIDGKPNIFNNVTMAITNRVGDGYDVILHPAFLEDINGTNFAALEKIS